MLVANGTSITDLAGGTTAYLKSRGFVMLAATNSSQKVSGTQVYAASGQQVAATVVVNALGVPSNAIQPAERGGSGGEHGRGHRRGHRRPRSGPLRPDVDLHDAPPGLTALPPGPGDLRDR